MATKRNFQTALDQIFRECEREGKAFVDVTARYLHQRVGGYPGRSHRMPTCCDVMKENRQPGDEILNEPPKGRGATLRIRYKLPRSQACRDQPDTLVVVSCTSKKIWAKNASADPYVPAKTAYVGKHVKDWLGKWQSKFNNHPWVILSAKYGFIEPEHPIGNYDVTFARLRSGPISDESLKNQVLYQSRSFRGQEIRLCNFKHVVVIGSPTYVKKTEVAFAGTGAKVIDFKRFCQKSPKALGSR